MSENDSEKTRISAALLSPGGMVNHYRISEKIGAGGMGEVYLAEDTKLNRKVALKFLPAHIAGSPDIRARFAREAQSAAQLDHPNIVTIHEVGEWESQPFISMQFIDGKTISHYCTEQQLSMAQVINIMLQVAEGLAKAHAFGITHRDIKSANIILDRELRPKILDFGLAAMQGSEMLTKAGSTLGTVAYMSPEQARGMDLDHRSDLFSFGVVMYEMIAGRTPFKMDNDMATMNKILNAEPEPLARFKSDVPPELQRVVAKCLAKNRDERYQSASDLAADLRTLARSLGSGEYSSLSKVASSKPSIAVLPFSNMSADPENEYFSDGLTEELLNVLAKNAELKVTGRTSSFAFKGKQEDLRGIGQKLGVGTILEGSVRKAGNRVRITAQLVNTADGFHLWSETYDRVLDDIFAVQDEIAGAVSKAMHVTLVGVSEQVRVVNPESYSLVLRAHQSQLQLTKESLSAAVDLYKKAIEIEPNNARAWAGLAYAYGHRVAYGHSEYDQETALAKQAADKAIAIDDNLAEAHLAKYFVLGALELKVKECVSEIRRAYELAPSDSTITTSLALCEVIFGNFERAISLAKTAIELDPLNPWARRELGRVLSCAGKYSEARETMLRALEMSPDMTTLYLSLGWIEMLEGKFEEARAFIEKERIGGYRYCGLAQVAFVQGNHEESDRYLSKLIGEGENWAFQIASVYAYRQEADKAFEWLERGYAVRDSGVPLSKVAPFLKSLHSDARWLPFLKKIGLD